MITDELITIFGFDIRDDGLKPLQDNIAKTTAKLGGFVAAALSVRALYDSAFETADTSRFARANDLAFESLERITFAGQEVGIAGGQVQSALQGIRRSAQEAATVGGGAARAFGILGIELRGMNGEAKKADQLLLEIADALARSDNPAFTETIIRQLGLGPEFNLLLRQGSAGINALADEGERLGLVLGNSAAPKSEAFARQIDRLKKAVQVFLIEQGLPFLDWVTKTGKAVLEFFASDDGKDITAFISQLSKDLFKLAGAPIEALFKVRDAFADAFGQNRADAIIGLSAAVALLGTRFGLTGLLIGGALLLLEDFLAFVNGKEGTGFEAITSKIADFEKNGFKDLETGKIRGLVDSALTALAPFPVFDPKSRESAQLNVEVTNNIEVSGAGDPSEVGREVERRGAESTIEEIRRVQSLLER